MRSADRRVGYRQDAPLQASRSDGSFRVDRVGVAVSVPVSSSLPPDHPLQSAGVSGSPLIRAARSEAVAEVPVWFMRQAGRSLPEYRALRAGGAMLDACFNTDLITEITLQPVRRHGVDAAILFSDIVVPLRAAGVDVTIQPGVGPVMAAPVRDTAGIASIGELGDTTAIEAAVTKLAAELGDTPLIGFCGAPFTLASYLVEGGPSREHPRTKAMMWGQPEVWAALMGRVADLCGQFLRRQILAGASAVQVFDSWAGTLSRPDYVRHVRPHTRRVLSHIADLPVPRIHFGVGTGELLSDMALPEVDVVGVDFRVELSDGIERIGPDHSVQGNLDPAALLAPPAVARQRAAAIIEQGSAARGHIFNLGHGVLPDTDADAITDLVAWIHDEGPEVRAAALRQSIPAMDSATATESGKVVP